ncbi:MAG: flagellar motor switch protein FliN [bacterium]
MAEEMEQVADTPAPGDALAEQGAADPPAEQADTSSAAEKPESIAKPERPDSESDDNGQELLGFDQNNLGLLMDVSLQVTVELGRKEMQFGEILQLGKGSVIELNKMAEDPIAIYVNQSKIAQGEVVVVDEHFGVRITKLMNRSNVIRNLG